VHIKGSNLTLINFKLWQFLSETEFHKQHIAIPKFVSNHVLIQRKSIPGITPISIQCHVREYLGEECTATTDIAEIQDKLCCKNFAGFTYPVAEKKLVIACAKMSSAANQMMLMSGKCRPWYSKNKYVRKVWCVLHSVSCLSIFNEI